MLTSLLTAITLMAPAFAETASDIIERARDVQRVENGIQQMEMVLVSRNGSERSRTFEMRVRKDGERVQTYVRFSKPTDVAGTQLIVVDNPDKADEQLLYLPALKRTNRIAGKARKGAFMGSDFSYEDLEVSDSDDAKHTLVSQTDGAWVIDTVPDGESSYGRIQSTVSKSDYLPRLVTFYDRKGQHKKTLEILETAKENGSIIPTRSVMRNEARGTSTKMNVTSWRLNVPAAEIPDETFTVGFMERNG